MSVLFTEIAVESAGTWDGEVEPKGLIGQTNAVKVRVWVSEEEI